MSQVDHALKTIKNIGNVASMGIATLFLLLLLLTSVYSVDADAEAIVTRFGKYVRTETPGLKVKLPFGIEKKYKVPVKRQLKLEFGFHTEGATNPYQNTDEDGELLQQKLMITGDKNAATVEWVVQYHIDNAKAYLFHVHEPEETLRDSSESIMREVVGDRSVDEVLTIGRHQIESESLQKLQTLIEHYGLGLRIDQVQLKNVNPPRPVEASFNRVNEAQQKREQMINQARGEYNKRVPRARGEADRRIAEAEGKATERINEAKGDAERFKAVLKEYKKAPEVTRQRLYLEKMAKLLPRLEKKIIIDEDVKGLLPLLNLNKLTE